MVQNTWSESGKCAQKSEKTAYFGVKPRKYDEKKSKNPLWTPKFCFFFIKIELKLETPGKDGQF